MRTQLLLAGLLTTTFYVPAHAYVPRNSPYYNDYIAYGPTYPSTLDLRQKTLRASAQNDFNFEVAKLVEAPATSFVPVEGTDWHNGTSTPRENEARSKFLQTHLTPAQLRRLTDSYSGDTADSAYAIGKDLPLILHAYTAGAVGFRNQDYKHAAERFVEALAVENGEPAYRVWASFMLGRTYTKLGVFDQAHDLFVQTRDLVAEGAPDPLGLAAASYGEEARLALDRAGGVLGESEFKPDQPDRLNQFHEAIRLYALQAQTGSKNGRDSLHILSKQIRNAPADFTLLMQDELARRLFLAYVRGYDRNYSDSDYYEYDSISAADNRKQNLTRLLPRFPLQDPAIADQLAAAAEELGQSALAEQYLKQTSSAYGTWVKAKLALGTGDMEKAAKLYDAALAQAKQEKPVSSIDPKNNEPAHEAAILTLARGQYMQAFKQFYAQRNRGDLHFLAERVLTIDELKTFVDAEAPEPPSTRGLEYSSADSIRRDNAQTVRVNLAQRLMRTGKYREAIPYVSKDLYDAAQEYAYDYDIADSSADPVTRAKAHYEMAVIMRSTGLDLYGTTLIDFANPDNPLIDNPYITPGERERLAASRAESPLPPSIRKITAEEAVKAADLLPPKSQAFAAVLCHASNWLTPADEAGGRQLYERYVHEGATVSWATHFGHGCPEPRFSTAHYQPVVTFFERIKFLCKRHPAVAIVSLILLLGTLTVMLRLRFRSFHFWTKI